MLPGIIGGFTNEEFEDKCTSNINYGYIKQLDHHARRIIIQSKVDWRDTDHDDYDGQFRVILVAQSDESANLDDRNLKGKIVIYPTSEEAENREDREKLPWFELIHTAKSKLEIYKSSRDQWENSRKELNEKYDELDRFLTHNNMKNHINNHFHAVHFEVSPQGFAKLGIDSDETSIDEEEKYVVLRQAFYYLKYSIHFHKHHHQKEDSLTTIIPLEQCGECDACKDKEKCVKSNNIEGLKMLGQLKRELTHLKRTYSSGGQKAYGEELGILSYMGSLCASLKHANYLCNDTYERECKYIDSLTSSFNVQANKRDKSEKCIEDINSTYRTYVAWAFSFISILWLIVIKGYIKYSENNQIDFTFDIYRSSALIIIAILCSISAYKYLVRRKINKTIDEKGFKSWVEKYYIISDQQYNKDLIHRILKVIFTAVVSIALCSAVYWIFK